VGGGVPPLIGSGVTKTKIVKNGLKKKFKPGNKN
jgi:hypothetical protein